VTLVILEYLFIYLLLGTVVGFFAGLLGIGGGTLIVPVLTALFLHQGLPTAAIVHIALGTSMASIVITSVVSLAAHHRKQGVLWKVVKTMAPGVIVGAFFGTFLVARLSAQFLAVFFTIFLFVIAIQMFLNKQPAPSRVLPGSLGLLGVASSIGVISSLVAIGGGALTVPYLVWCNTPVKKAIGTAAALGFPIALSGTIGYVINGWNKLPEEVFMLGYVYLPAVIGISLATFFTAPVGASFAHRLPTASIKKIFAIFTLMLGLKMLNSIF
jgi:uncharacterized membrane protein YfcA